MTRSVEHFRFGDYVERTRGKHAGVVGRVVGRIPTHGLVAIRIKVQIDHKISEVTDSKWRKLYKQYYAEQFTNVNGWRKFNG